MTDYFANEEEVVRRLILPELAKYGLMEHELQHERSVYLKFGRNSLLLSKEGVGRKGAGARYDILVSLEGRNLAMIEAKADQLELTDADRDQGISYARLTHPITPVTVVTNGRDWRWYDTITKEVIEPADFEFRGLRPALPDTAYQEALERFVGLDSGNAIRISQAQVATCISPLTAEHQPDTAIFQPNLYVPSSSLDEGLASFLAGDKQLFLVGGKSGAGKTWWSAITAKQLSQNGQLVFFFRARNLRQSLVGHLAEELGWATSQSLSKKETLRRLHRLFGPRDWFVLVDGLDELEGNRSSFLDDAVQRLAEVGGRVIATIKSNHIDEVLVPSGEASLAAIAAYRPIPILGERTMDEFHSLLQGYRDHYDWHGRLSLELQQILRRSPHQLRVAVKLGAELGTDVLSLKHRGFHEAVLDMLLRRLAAPPAGQQALETLASTMWTEDSEWLSLSTLSRAGLLVDGPLRDLENLGLLRIGRQGVAFEQDVHRDFVLAEYVLRLSEQPAGKLADILDGWSQSNLKRSVCENYYNWAAAAHQTAIDGGLSEALGQLLHRFTRALTSTFKSTRFSSNKPAMRAFVSLATHKVQTHGYADEQLWGRGLTVFSDPRSSPLRLPDLKWAYVGGTAVRRFRGPTTSPPQLEQDLRDDFSSEVDRMFKNGLLDENGAPALLHERLHFAASVAFRDARLRFSQEQIREMPISEIVRRLGEARLTEVELDRQVERKLRSGVIAVSWFGSLQTYSVPAATRDERAAARAVAVAQLGSLEPRALVAECGERSSCGDAIRLGRLLEESGADHIGALAAERLTDAIQTAREFYDPTTSTRVPAEVLDAVRDFLLICIESYESVVASTLTDGAAARIRALDGRFGFAIDAGMVGPYAVNLVIAEVQCAPNTPRVVVADIGPEQTDSGILNADGASYHFDEVSYGDLFVAGKAYLPYEEASRHCIPVLVRTWVYERMKERVMNMTNDIIRDVIAT